MKKISILFLSLFVMVLITGCGAVEEVPENQQEPQKPKEQTLVCTTTETEDGINSEQVISMTYQEDKLKHMTMKINMAFTDSDIKENWEEFKKSEDLLKELNKEGISLKVSFNDQNYEYSTVLDIDIEKASEEDLAEQGFEGLKGDTSTLEESKESAENDGATCVIK